MLDSMLKRKEYSNTGKDVVLGIAYDCSLNWYRRFLKSAGNGRVHKKKGKLLISHRYDHIPLLDSSPGGVCGSWSYKPAILNPILQLD